MMYACQLLNAFNCKFNDINLSQQYNAGRTSERGESNEGNGAPGQDVQESKEGAGPGETESMDHESGHARSGIRKSL